MFAVSLLTLGVLAFATTLNGQLYEDPTALGCNNFGAMVAPGYCAIYASNSSFSSYGKMYECQSDNTMLEKTFTTSDCSGDSTDVTVGSGNYLCGQDTDCSFFGVYTFLGEDCDTSGIQALSIGSVTGVCALYDSGVYATFGCTSDSWTISAYADSSCSSTIQSTATTDISLYALNSSSASFAIYCSDQGSLGTCSTDAAHNSLSLPFALKIILTFITTVVASSSF